MMQKMTVFKLRAARDLTVVDGGLVCSSLQVKILKINTSAVLKILLILPV
jgi:hypothetical protein